MKNDTVVFIAEELPMPHRSGYATYNHAFLSALRSCDYKVHLIICGDRFPSVCFNATRLLDQPDLSIHIPQAIRLPGGWYLARPQGFLKALYRQYGKFFNSLQKILPTAKTNKPVVIGRWLNQHDLTRLTPILESLSPQLIFVDTLFRSPVLNTIKHTCCKLLIGHDVFSMRCQSMADNGIQPTPWIDRQNEAEILEKFDAIIAITETDAAEYRELQPNSRVITLPAPVTPATQNSTRPNSGRIFYLGSQAHHNVDGLQWFLEQVWPLVLKNNADLWLDVVGSISASISSQHPNILLHGRLDNFSALAEQAMFAINPVRAGSGMKIKILDYLAHGLACITTSVGAAGFPSQQERPLTVCDNAQSFAQTIIEWSGNAAYCNHLSTQALVYVTRFSGSEFNTGLHRLITETLTIKESA